MSWFRKHSSDETGAALLSALLVMILMAAVTAGLAWALSGDPVRAVAVLVVATPCPLILAAPVAIVAGLSRAARFGVVIKGGAALERLANGEVLLFDKTGTLTAGQPIVVGIHVPEGMAGRDALRLAACLDQVSPHVLATAIVKAARQQGLELPLPAGVSETAGQGIRGTVEGHDVWVGKLDWLGEGLDQLRRSGWRGSGYVRWAHDTNRGFLRALDGLRRSAAAIAEHDEEERCDQFLHQLDPDWDRRPAS